MVLAMRLLLFLCVTSSIQGFDIHSLVRSVEHLGCIGQPVDIAFVVDSVVSEPLLASARNVINMFINNWDVDGGNVRVSLIQYGTSPVIRWNLDGYINNRVALIAAVNNLTPMAGHSNLHLALDLARTGIFGSNQGERPSAPDVAIVFSDGQSTSPSSTASSASALRGSGVEVFSMWDNCDPTLSEYQNIASSPTNDHIFCYHYTTDQDIVSQITNDICPVTPCSPSCANGGTCNLGTCSCVHGFTGDYCQTMLDQCAFQQGCLGQPRDIAIIVDESGTVTPALYTSVKFFIELLINCWSIDNDNVRVALLEYADQSTITWDLDEFIGNRTGLLGAVAGITRTSGGSFLNKALDQTGSEVFDNNQGDRPLVPDVAIVFSDGQSTLPSSTASSASALRGSGVEVFSVWDNCDPTLSEFQNIASSPKDDHIYCYNFNTDSQIVAQLTDVMCPPGATTTTTTTTPIPCSPPCANDGTCNSGVCHCLFGYTGSFCQSIIDSCASCPCDINADCTNIIGGSFTCTCKPGYTGNGFACSEIDECASNPCDVNAECIDMVNGFFCYCTEGWTGTGVHCSDINECHIHPPVCGPDATCTNTHGSFTCACNSGFAGDPPYKPCEAVEYCGPPVNEYVCDKDADCVEVQTGVFQCICKTGYTGSGTECSVPCDEPEE